MQIKDAIISAFMSMPTEFSVIELVSKVRLISGRPMVMDSSITAQMRRLRSQGLISYRVSDHNKAIYRKTGAGVQMMMDMPAPVGDRDSG